MAENHECSELPKTQKRGAVVKLTNKFFAGGLGSRPFVCSLCEWDAQSEPTEEAAQSAAERCRPEQQQGARRPS